MGATPRVLRQALYDREPLAEWRVGRVVLLGDAAHSIMPFYAQGAGQSIEDAYVLAGCLALWPGEPVAALERYVRLRQPPRLGSSSSPAVRNSSVIWPIRPTLLAVTPAYGRTRVWVQPHFRLSKSAFIVTMRKRSCVHNDRFAELSLLPSPTHQQSCSRCSSQPAGSGRSNSFSISVWLVLPSRISSTVRRQQRQAQDPTHIALRDVLGVAHVADRRVDALIEHPLPTRPRERLDQRAVRLRLGCGTISLPSGATMRLRPPRRWNRMGCARRGCARRTECPRKSVSIATLNTIAPGQLARPCSPSPPRGAPQIRAARPGTAWGGDRSELFAGRVVLTLVWGVRV